MNHLGDTNKMVSRNPRMDASAHDDGAIWQTGCELERELNAANQRIKRLEREVYTLRLYGNKDCTSTADEALTKETKQ